MRIPFTFYRIPKGRRQGCAEEVSDELEADVEAIWSRGWFFEAEEMRTGQVALTVTDEENGDLVCEIVAHDPQAIHDGVVAIIERGAKLARGDDDV